MDEEVKVEAEITEENTSEDNASEAEIAEEVASENDGSASENDGSASENASEAPKRRAGGKHAFAIEVLAVVVIFYFALSGLSSKFVFKKFAPFKVEAEATVSSIDEVVFTGSAKEAKKLGDLADSKYSTTFVYEVNGQVYESELYSKAYPSFEVGDEVTLYVDATDLTSIVSVK